MENKLVVILGPTASGKTSFAVNLANKINSEIISADSRQIYQGMDIGTGKDLSEYIINNKIIPYHLINILKPCQDYSVFQFKEDFFNCYNSLNEKKKNSILCGGTGLYIESVLLDYNIPNIAADNNLRDSLNELSKEDLIIILKKIDEIKFNSEFHTTKRRLIRTIEIANNPKANNIKTSNLTKIDDFIVFGIDIKRESLLELIEKRLIERFDEGMIDEVESLINSGIDYKRLQYFGLEYKIIGEYFFQKISLSDMKLKLKFAINKFSKRQMTFFRRMEKRGIKIHWVQKKDYEDIELFIEKYSL